VNTSGFHFCARYIFVIIICYNYGIVWNIINYVKSQRLSWFGLINRMPETSIVKKIYKWKPFTSRLVGRPKSRWEDDVRNDLKKMKIIKWTEQAQNHLKWKDIVEKAKTI
jgi:hypothetical protein